MTGISNFSPRTTHEPISLRHRAQHCVSSHHLRLRGILSLGNYLMLKACAIVAIAYFFLPVILCAVARVYDLLCLIPQIF